ncbi:MAG: helix-turn-helix transcriptional regulator [Kiritimatiellaceae bacterium]|nr:helix-turn-helix transcriptional regulator [Kiritimatiellaceae bacterium]
MNNALLQIPDPADYFKGAGHHPLPVPANVLLFVRTTKNKLQEEALQSRSHHRFVLIFNLATEGRVHIDHLELHVKPGQSLLILPYQFHHFSLLASAKLKWLFCTFELTPHTFLEPLRNRVVDTGEPTQQSLKNLLEEWHRPASELQAGKLQTDLLHLLLSLKQDRQRSGSDLPPEPEDNLLRTVNRLMAEWRGRTVATTDLAQTLNLSESRLRVLFKEAAGIPLGQYMQNYRINRAMALLRTTDFSIADIAAEAGFGSPQAFSRIFKEKTNDTPRAYRQGGQP